MHFGKHHMSCVSGTQPPSHLTSSIHPSAPATGITSLVEPGPKPIVLCQHLILAHTLAYSLICKIKT